MPENIIKNSKKILLLSHIQPDGDAIGSLLALGLSLKAQGKDVLMYNQDDIPPSLLFLPGVEEIRKDIGQIDDFDLLITLDCGDEARIGRLWPEFKKIPQIINMDHHPSNSEFGSCNLVDEEAAATAVLVYRLIRSLNCPLEERTALALYTAIFTDTGGFKHGNTNKECFEIASELLDYKVSPKLVAEHIQGEYSLGYIKLLQKTLATIKLSSKGKLASMLLTQRMLEDTDIQESEVSGLVNYARQIKGVELALLLKEKEDGSYKASLRSSGRIDVSSLALKYQGGGHKAAAGFSSSLSQEEIIAEVEKYIEDTEA